LNFNNFYGRAFGVVFLMIVLAGFSLAFSVKLGAIMLGVAFVMNLGLYIMLFFAGALNLDDDMGDDYQIHP
jgi:hypothetical protein